MRCRWSFLGIVTLLATPLFAHPYPRSHAEIDYRAECHCLEVAIAVAPEDLEALLARRIGRRIPLEAPAIDAALVGYLKERFVVSAAGVKRKIEWVGKEIDSANAWLYFKVLDVPTEFELSVRLLFEREPTQVNQVLVRNGERRRALTFRAETRSARVNVANLSQQVP